MSQPIHETGSDANGIGRRRFLNSAAALGITSVGLAACQERSESTAGSIGAGSAPAPAPAAASHVGGAGSVEVKPWC